MWSVRRAIFSATSSRGARGYFVSTIGLNKEMTRAYIKNLEMADKLQLKLVSP
jgi:hypothetical protein